jgi:riboflavin synthase
MIPPLKFADDRSPLTRIAQPARKLTDGKSTAFFENIQFSPKNHEIRTIMFTGIIESLGTIVSIENQGTNRTFWVESSISGQLTIDQSVSHNGVCLTVDALAEGRHRVTAIEETLKKTDLGDWQTGGQVNLERSMLLNGRLDGHIVQGHVDATGRCIQKTDKDGSWEFRFDFPVQFANLVIENGSISLNGTSLTIFNVTGNSFDVAIIPYTYTHTSIGAVKPGSLVNLEFDMIGKYVARIQQTTAQKR